MFIRKPVFEQIVEYKYNYLKSNFFYYFICSETNLMKNIY